VPAAGGGSHVATAEEEALELLNALGSLLRAPLQPAAAATAASPLLSPRVGSALPPAAGGGEQAAADQQQQQREVEEAAVKAFLKRLPQQGVGRRDLARMLLQTLGTASGAAALSPPVRLQLLQVVHQVQHEGLPLSLEHCLVLGELFVDAVAAAARGAGKPAAAAAHDGSPSGPRRGAGASGGLKRPGSIRTRRGELGPEALQQSAHLWLSRYRLAAVEGAAAAAAPATAEARLGGMVRHWWATGRLLESGGDMPAASAAYANCQEALKLLGAWVGSVGRWRAGRFSRAGCTAALCCCVSESCRA
jgi:hypothetical protein